MKISIENILPVIEQTESLNGCRTANCNKVEDLKQIIYKLKENHINWRISYLL